MPEGDTVHHMAGRMRGALEGKVPEQLSTPHPRHAMDRWPERLAGLAVRSVDAYGKHLFLRLQENLTLHSHLRMTGTWGVYRAGQRWRRSPRRAWLVIRCGGVEVVQFDGPVLELMSDTRARLDPHLTMLGEDVLGEDFAPEHFLARLREDDPARAIGDALLDQRNLAGIGNVWKAESCFAAAVSPWRVLADLADQQALEIVQFARSRMRRCAQEGTHTRPRAVYGRAGQPCPRCGERVRARGQGEQIRVTFWCPGCQC
jgi:endonuclease-8